MTAEARHGFLGPTNGIHVSYQWSYADAAARTGATGFVATDVGKLARQVDDNSIWLLTATTPTWVKAGGTPPPGYFGNGSAGDVTISSNTDLETTPAHYNNLTIAAGQTLTVTGATLGLAPVIYVKETLTINGKISVNGQAGGVGSNNSTGTGGAAGTVGNGGFIGYGSSIAGVSGGAGGDASLNGANGLDADLEGSFCAAAQNDAAKTGAAGGAGAAGTAGAGGAGSEGYLPLWPNYATAVLMLFQSMDAGALLGVLYTGDSLPGGAGGGGGGNTAGGGGGGGGGGHGGNLSIIARHIVWGAAGAIEAKGGAGGNGGNSDGDGGGGGGGGGGNGGIVVLVYEDETGTRNVDLAAGAGGDGGTSVSSNPGADGPDGYAGLVVDLGL